MNSGSFGAAASTARRLTIMWPFSAHAEADIGTVRRRRIVIGRYIEAKSLTEIERTYNQTMGSTIGHVAMEAQCGDISQANVDAVVNAANNHFWMGAGVAGALKRAGGAEIEREAVAQGPVETG